MAFKLSMTVDVYMAYYAHARFDDIDLAARSQWVGKGKTKKSALNDIDKSKQAMSITFFLPALF